MTSAGPGKFVIGLHSHEHVGLEPEGPNLSLLLNERIDLSPEMALKLEAAEIIANIKRVSTRS